MFKVIYRFIVLFAFLGSNFMCSQDEKVKTAGEKIIDTSKTERLQISKSLTSNTFKLIIDTLIENHSVKILYQESDTSLVFKNVKIIVTDSASTISEKIFIMEAITPDLQPIAVIKDKSILIGRLHLHKNLLMVNWPSFGAYQTANLYLIDIKAMKLFTSDDINKSIYNETGVIYYTKKEKFISLYLYRAFRSFNAIAYKIERYQKFKKEKEIKFDEKEYDGDNSLANCFINKSMIQVIDKYVK